MSDKLIIHINMPEEENEPLSLLDEMRNLSDSKPLKVKNKKREEPEPVLISSLNTKTKKKEEKKKKKNKKSIISDSDFISLNESFNEESEETTNNNESTESIIDIDELLREIDDCETEIDEDIIDEQKGNYKKLKKDENNFKKEFAEELTLLYNLLDETSKYGKDLEKDLKTIKSAKTRGVSKYSNDLADIVLSTKQTKLNILKEITSVKKTIADLKMKADDKARKSNEGENASTESLASAYFKNVLAHGRNNFVRDFAGGQEDYDDDLAYSINQMKTKGVEPSDRDYDEYNDILEERLNELDNPFRSEEGNKYIKYENSGIKLKINKCIDTGEWEMIAIDKFNQRVDDYPIPSRRDLGKIKFSADGRYASDEKGRMYDVIEYYLPENEEDDDYEE